LLKNPVLAVCALLVEAVRALEPNEALTLPDAESDSSPLFYLTGFGAFAGVTSNPTSQLMNNLNSSRPRNVLGLIVVETSMGAVREACAQAQQLVRALASRKAPFPFAPVVFVHFGVDASALERWRVIGTTLARPTSAGSNRAGK
jgi:hypothetical protein